MTAFQGLARRPLNGRREFRGEALFVLCDGAQCLCGGAPVIRRFSGLCFCPVVLLSGPLLYVACELPWEQYSEPTLGKNRHHPKHVTHHLFCIACLSKDDDG